MVILALRTESRLLTAFDTGDAADHQARTSAYCSPLLTAKGGTGDGPHRCTEHRSGCCRLLRSLLRTCTPRLLHGIPAARAFIGAKCVKRASASRQDHDTWPGRGADAGR